MINVYLDDFRPCPKGFVPAFNARECIALLEECEIDVLSLDYDLGWNEPTGIDVVTHMISHGLYPRRIYLHSSDPRRKRTMYEMLYAAKPEEVVLHHHALTDCVLAEAAAGAEEERRRRDDYGSRASMRRGG